MVAHAPRGSASSDPFHAAAAPRSLNRRTRRSRGRTRFSPDLLASCHSSRATRKGSGATTEFPAGILPPMLFDIDAAVIENRRLSEHYSVLVLDAPAIAAAARP